MLWMCAAPLLSKPPLAFRASASATKSTTESISSQSVVT